jgi:hypothetical protein
MSSGVGIIDIDPLVRIRKSFLARWRLPIVTCVALFQYVFWVGGILKVPDGQLFPDHHQAATVLVFALFLAIGARASFWKDAFSRLYFTVGSGLVAMTSVLLLAAFMYSKPMGEAVRRGEPGKVAMLIGVAVVLLQLIVTWLIHPTFELFLSVVPVGRGRAYRQQVHCSLQADDARRTAARNLEAPASAARPASTPALLPLLTLGSIAFLAALYFLRIALTAFQNGQLLRAITAGRFRDVVMLNLSFKNEVLGWKETFTSGLVGFAFCLLVLVSMRAFAFLWHRWQRSRIVPLELESSQSIPAGYILLLRHANDDVMPVFDRSTTLTRLPFLAYERNYTFEELIASRLTFVGPLCAFDTPGRELRHDLLPRGSPRIHTGADWVKVLQDGLPGAPAVVVIIGAAENGVVASPALQTEMTLLKEAGHLDKTIFLMPPLILSWRIAARWRAFLNYLPPSCTLACEKLKAARILAVCFHDGEPVIITGSGRGEPHYQSVLDVAGTIAGRGDEDCGTMIERRLKSPADVA